MGNTLTGLIPDIYAAMDVVSRELVGFIPACTLDADASRAALNQEVIVPLAPAAAAEDIVPGAYPPDTGDQDFDSTKIKITKSRTVPFRWTGEEQRSVSTGPGYITLRAGQIAQALRTLCNEVEADLGGLFVNASRAYGTPGTTPFGNDLGDSAQVLKLLKDNGAPETDLHLVIDTAAGAKLRTLANLTKANEAGTTALREQGILLPLHGLTVRESAKVKYHTKGTGAGYLTNLTGPLSIGATAIAADTGAGTILAGDILSFEGDAEKYVCATGLSAGSFSINRPGLFTQALADGKTITVGNSFRANMAFHRGAMILAARAPALPEEGDAAADRMIVTDPRSGLAFEFAMYPQYRRIRYEVSLAWGVANIKPEHTALLLG